MSTPKKSRSDSALKTLPAARQEAIAEYARTKSLAETVTWLAADGIKTSNASLSDFLSWYALNFQFRQDELTTEALVEQLAKEVPGLTEEQLDDLGQRTFSLLAIRRQDLKGFVSVRSARTKAQLEREKLKLQERAENRATEQLKLEREKFELLAAEKMLDKALRAKADEINNSNLSNADKIAAMRREAFRSVDELQQSGQVKIPKA